MGCQANATGSGSPQTKLGYVTAMDAYPHHFEAQITHHDVGAKRYAYTVLYVPGEILAKLPSGRNRAVGEINDHPFAGALHPSPLGHYLLLSKALLRDLEVGLGDWCCVRFALDDPNGVETPLALRDALSEDEGLRALWEAQSPGKQRGLAHLVETAKTPQTQAKRVATVRGTLEGRLDRRGKPVG
ncbi:MAG: YdeI/OmpD-associated family protein [Pseudomonadota bacterium]